MFFLFQSMKRNKNLFPAKAARNGEFASVALDGVLLGVTSQDHGLAYHTVGLHYRNFLGSSLIGRLIKYVSAVVFVPPVKAPGGRDL